MVASVSGFYAGLAATDTSLARNVVAEEIRGLLKLNFPYYVNEKEKLEYYKILGEGMKKLLTTMMSSSNDNRWFYAVYLAKVHAEMLKDQCISEDVLSAVTAMVLPKTFAECLSQNAGLRRLTAQSRSPCSVSTSLRHCLLLIKKPSSNP